MRGASIGGHTPQTARVEVIMGQRRIGIDFLDNVLVANTGRMRTSATILQLKVDINGSEESLDLSILHPLRCLQRRLVIN